MLGITNIKKIIAFGLDLADDVRKAGEDGKFTIKDAPLFFDDGIKIPSIIKSAPLAFHEFLDLDAAENEEIRLWIKARMNVGDQNVDELIRAAINVAVDVGQLSVDVIELAQAIKNLKK